jgi:hypothetical protein
MSRNIDVNKIQKSIYYNQGVNADIAVLTVFECDLRVVFSLDHLARYVKNPNNYVDDCKSEFDVSDSFHDQALSEVSIAHHTKILQKMSLMKTLRNQLLSDIYYQLKGKIDKRISISKYEELNCIWVANYQDKAQEVDYALRDENIEFEDVLPETEALALEDVLVSFESLCLWFKRFSIDIPEWKTREDFIKADSYSPTPQKKKRNTTKTTDTTLAILGAVIKSFAKTKANYIKPCQNVNVDVLAKDLINSVDGIGKLTNVTKYINSALGHFDEHCKEIKKKNENIKGDLTSN